MIYAPPTPPPCRLGLGLLLPFDWQLICSYSCCLMRSSSFRLRRCWSRSFCDSCLRSRAWSSLVRQAVISSEVRMFAMFIMLTEQLPNCERTCGTRNTTGGQSLCMVSMGSPRKLRPLFDYCQFANYLSSKSSCSPSLSLMSSFSMHMGATINAEFCIEGTYCKAVSLIDAVSLSSLALVVRSKSR